jgi:hypothetical protein
MVVGLQFEDEIEGDRSMVGELEKLALGLNNGLVVCDMAG